MARQHIKRRVAGVVGLVAFLAAILGAYYAALFGFLYYLESLL